ncbi:hypothetical protein Trydic_g4722 [Trypoxylus dichotomus]
MESMILFKRCNQNGCHYDKGSSGSSLALTIKTDTTQRCPVTWNNDKKHRGAVAAQYLTDNLTPALNNRVQMWLTSTLQLQQAGTSPLHHSIIDQSDSRSSSSVIDSYFSGSVRKDQLPKRNILIRHDFTPNNEVISNIRSYNPNLRCKNNEAQLNGCYKVRKEYPSVEIGENDCFLIKNGENSDTSSEDVRKARSKFNSEVPLSPETQKKNELCSYLQLMNMNCADQKLASKIQNRRSTRVKNLMQMTKKRELERQLNNEAKKKEKESIIDEKKGSISSVILEESNEEVQGVHNFEGSSNSTLNLLGPNPQNKLKRRLSSKSLDNFNANMKDNKVKFASTTGLANVRLKRRNSLNSNAKGRDSLSKPFDTLNLDVKRERGYSDNDSNLNLFHVHNIPMEILSKHIDFDETIRVFMEMENCTPKPHKIGRKRKKMARKDEIKRDYVKRRYIKKVKYANGSFNNFSSISSSKTIFKKTQLQSHQSQNPYHKQFKKRLSKESNSIKSKQNFNGKRKKYYTILLRNTGRQNLRSKTSLSNVGIKTLILKDKNDNDDDKKSIQIKKQKVYKERKKSTESKNSSKHSQNSKRETNKKSIIDEKKSTDEDVEIISLANSFPPRPRMKFEELLWDGDKVDESAGLIEAVTPKFQKTPQNFTYNSCRKGSPNETTKKSELRIVKSPNKNNTVDSVNERTFNIIDLSHSKVPNSIDTLTDHDYTLKSPTDKNYIMNVILGTNEKSPVIETVGMSSISDDSYSKSPESLLSCKEQEYCREKLEEIIGVPWKNLNKSDIKSKSTDSLNNIHVSNSKIETIEQKSPRKSFSQYEYTPLVLKPSSPNKSYNIRIPSLIIPPTNIFEEGSCSPSSVEHSVETQATPSDELDGKPQITPMPVPSEVKNLHKSLMHQKRRSQIKNELAGDSSNHTWDNETSCEDKRSHSIKIFPNNGNVVNAFYVDFNLTIVQEQSVSLWCQSALGNMLGSQDLWISKGSLQRLVLDNTCVFKESPDMVISLENSFAYVELWTKEHKSDKRERPLADVFATVYFWRHRQNVPNRKFLQLENINGKGSDVQYIVLRNSGSIVVSWVEIRDDMKKTVVHCYTLAPDYQTVVSIREMDTVDHCVTSLHNIEDCNTMVMGFGEEQVTLWNLEYGYVVATIEIKSVSANPRCVWIKCDRGFLFLLQYHQLERLLVLIAINGITHSWKRLQVFRPPYGYDGLQGVCIDNNVLAAFFQGGVLCWNIQSGESVIEEMSSQTTYLPCDKHIVMLNSDKVQVQQFLSYFITSFDLQ